MELLLAGFDRLLAGFDRLLEGFFLPLSLLRFEPVITSAMDQTGSLQNREWIAELREPASQTTARRVAHAHVRDDLGGMDSALVQIRKRLVIAVQLEAIEIDDCV